MAVVKVENKTYTVDPLYQWDKNQVLEIRGLSLAAIPEIHFANAAMSRAIVRQSTMDASGIITVGVPNSLLQIAGKAEVYVCIYEGSTFKTLYKLEVPVKARTMPGDYTLTNDQEVYSFNALENKVDNTLVELQEKYDKFTKETKRLAEAAAASAKTAEEAAAEAAAEAVTSAMKQAILKSEITEIVKVTYVPGNPNPTTLYIVV